MHGRRFRTALASSALACSLLSHGAWAQQAWTLQPHPKPSGTSEFLWDVVAFDQDTAFAAGHRYATFGGVIEFRSVVLRWDGAQWTQMSTIDIEAAPARTFLRGIGGTSAGDVWAVGEYKPVDGGPYRSLVAHWDGVQWLLFDTPPSPPGGAYLYKVSAATTTDAWAVGHTYDLSTRENPLALHWDGISWKAVPVPAVPGCVNGTQLTDVTTRPTGSAWASGFCNASGGVHQGFVLRWNGRRWRVVAGQAEVAGDTMLNSIDIVGREVWAVGDRSSDTGGNEPLVLRYAADTGWTELPIPEELHGVYPSLQAVQGLFTNHVWVVGQDDNATAPSLVDPLTLLWNGTTWQRFPAGTAMRTFGVDVTRTGHAWLVGLFQQSDDSMIQARRGPARPR